MPEDGQVGRTDQRRRKWLVLGPAYAVGVLTGSVLLKVLSGPLYWVLPGIVGILVFLVAYKVLDRVVMHKARSKQSPS